MRKQCMISLLLAVSIFLSVPVSAVTNDSNFSIHQEIVKMEESKIPI